MTLGIDTEGEYLNIAVDGKLRVSISEERNELLVYEDGVDEPAAKYTLDDGVEVL